MYVCELYARQICFHCCKKWDFINFIETDFIDVIIKGTGVNAVIWVVPCYWFVLSISLSWTGLRDPIAFSILSGGIPTQNIGYKSTRL